MDTKHFSDELMTALVELKAQQELTAEQWPDGVAERFFSDYMQKYDQVVETFLQGNGQEVVIQGRGFDDLSSYLEQNLQQLNQL